MGSLNNFSDLAVQVIEHLPNGWVRIYNIVPEESHEGDDDDPLTTIVVDGYEDIQP